MARLDICDIHSLRTNAGPISMAVGACSSSDQFKSRQLQHKPRSEPLGHLLSVEGRSSQRSSLKKPTHQAAGISYIPLGTGRPNAELYPWRAVSYQPSWNPQDMQKIEPPSPPDIADLTVIEKHEEVFGLATGLNYSQGAGSPALLRFVTEHVELVHNPSYKNWSTCLSSGSTSALEMALRLLCNRGDTILMERYTYSGAIEAARLHGLQICGIEMDSGGIIISQLEHTLRTWGESQSRRPTVLYAIPSGQNPSGATLSSGRRKALCQMAVDYDLIIVEDDPYHFLRTDWNVKTDLTFNETTPDDEAYLSAYLASLPPSLLSLDTSGRVVRLDSAAKILAPGLRAGWVTGSDEIIEKFVAYFDVSTVSVSGPTQLMLWNLLDATWGHKGFYQWLHQLSMRYQTRLRYVLDACESYLPQEMCKWKRPQSGMFLWIDVDTSYHPVFASRKGRDLKDVASGDESTKVEARIVRKAMENGVQITAGSLFDTRQTSSTTIHFRLTYAAAEELDLGNGVKIFANALREEFGLRLLR